MARLTVAQLRKKHQSTFDQFWKVYPRHTHINEASKAWGELMESGADPAAVIASAQRYAASVMGTDLKYVPGPHKWIAAGQYEDADLFQDEQQLLTTWMKQMWKNADVKAVENRFHVKMEKQYPPEDLTDTDSIRFWYREAARAWITTIYKQKVENCPQSPSTMSEPNSPSLALF